MNKRDWLSTRRLGARPPIELMLGASVPSACTPSTTVTERSPAMWSTQRYQVSEYFNRDGIFGAFLIWDEMDCVLGVEDASCNPGHASSQCRSTTAA